MELFLTLPPLLFLILRKNAPALGRRRKIKEGKARRVKLESGEIFARQGDDRQSLPLLGEIFVEYLLAVPVAARQDNAVPLIHEKARRLLLLRRGRAEHAGKSMPRFIRRDILEQSLRISLVCGNVAAGKIRAYTVLRLFRRKVSVMTVGTFTERRSISDISFM